jgi:hypothetical protein
VCVCVCRFGGSKADWPQPAVDLGGFMSAVAAANAREKQTWSPIRKGVRPWIEMDELRQFATAGGCIFA